MSSEQPDFSGSESPASRFKNHIKSAVLFTREAVKTIAVTSPQLPKVLETRSSRKDREQQRREYKFAVLQPYFDKLPMNVAETMLDIDLKPIVDQQGNVYPSQYERDLKHGVVDEVIRTNRPLSGVVQTNNPEAEN